LVVVWEERDPPALQKMQEIFNEVFLCAFDFFFTELLHKTKKLFPELYLLEFFYLKSKLIYYNFVFCSLVVCDGEVDERCQPDPAGRQISLKPNLYPTDVLNILTETGGFVFRDSSSQGTVVIWNLEK